MAVTQSTTNVIKATAAADVVSATAVFIKAMNWSGTDKVANDVLIVTDTAGNEIWKAICSVNAQDNLIVFNKPLPIIGVTVGTMTANHGDFYLYLE